MGRKARSRRLTGLPDHIPSRPKALFVGINPGIRSAEVGHHFAGPSNRFWKLLHESGLTPERLGFEDDVRLRELGYGITNIVARPTRGVDDLTADEYVVGAEALREKVRRARPGVVALVGVTVYRRLYPKAGRPGAATGLAALGLAPETFAGRPVFVVPNPSGRNATVTYDEMLAAYRELRQFLETNS